MTEHDKIVHLLKRFGFGASGPELKLYASIGLKGTITKLLEIGKEPEWPHPFRFMFKKGEEAEPNTYRVRNYWMYRCAVSDTPLRERLALFWHDHFAVDDNKVEDGLAMLGYLEALRADPLGRFEDIMNRVIKQPAFLEMLDVRIMRKGTPNENFAREVLELYTFGVGNYSEKDIKEIARCFTGWSYVNTYYETEGKSDQKLKTMKQDSVPYSAYSYIPAFHDSAEKSFFGYKGNFKGDDVIKLLAKDKRTASYLCRKLWEHFICENPDQATLDSLIKVYTETDGRIGTVIKHMMTLPQAYSEKVVNTRVRSPFDLVVGINRLFGIREEFLSKVLASEQYDKPIDEFVMNHTGSMAWHSYQMGQELLCPPSVAGWDWGKGWISSDSMLKRMNFHGTYTWFEKKKDEWHPTAGLQRIVDDLRPSAALPIESFVAEFLKYHDAGHLSAEARIPIMKHFEKSDFTAKKEDRDFGWMITVAFKLLTASPEYHLH